MRRLLLIVLLCTACAKYRDFGERFGGGTVTVRHLQQAPSTSTFMLRVPVTTSEVKPIGIYVSLLGTIDAFWDGEPIGSSGGAMDNLFVVRTPPGSHVLTLRVTPIADAARIPYFGGIAIGDYAHMARSRIVSQLIPLSGLGVFLVIGIYFLVLPAERRAPLIVFAILCFAASLLVVAETWRWIVGYGVEWHLERLQIVSMLTIAVSLLLALFFALELRLSRWWFALAAVAILGAFAMGESFDDRCFAAFRASVVACVVFVIARRRVDLSIGAAILACAMLFAGFGFSDSSLFLAFAAFILLQLVSLALRERRERVRAARLEIELLKKSIQPHFLMNSITAVMEWIEENPAEGIRFLESLSEELRLFGEMAGERVVPLERELALCRSHLTIMSARKRTQFALDADVDPDDAVPPAIFHTLIENAITHNHYGDGDVTFTLRGERRGKTRQYAFEAPVDNVAATTSRDGVGLRYVKARLEEAFPGMWRVDAGLHERTWRTTIEVRA